MCERTQKDKQINFYHFLLVNGLTGAPNVLPPYALGLGTPLSQATAYSQSIQNLGAFSLASTAGSMGSVNPAALRGFSNVLLVSSLNEEVSVCVHANGWDFWLLL